MRKDRYPSPPQRWRPSQEMHYSTAGQKFGRLENLDIFRGICALSVFVYHLQAHIPGKHLATFGSWQLAAYDLTWRVLQPLSTLAVLGFFVLSGVVITLYILRDIAPEGRYLEFLTYRFTRIAIVCIPVTLVSVALAYIYQTAYPGPPWPRYQDYSLTTILASATGFGREWNWPGWTLVIEWSFYFLLVAMLALTRPRPLNLAIALLCAGYLALSGVIAAHQNYLISFFFGVALVPLIGTARQSPKLVGFAGLVLLAAVIAHPAYSEAYKYTFIKSIPLAMLVLSLAATEPLGGRSGAVLHYLGKISFSLYLWHWPVIIFGNYYLFGSYHAKSVAHAATMLILYPIITILIAHYSYYYLERHYKLPFLRRHFGTGKSTLPPGQMGGAPDGALR